MPYRKKTLRAMTPTARKLAKLQGEIDSAARRLKAIIQEVNDIEASLKVATLANDRRAVILETPEGKRTAQEIAHRALFPDQPPYDFETAPEPEQEKGEAKR